MHRLIRIILNNQAPKTPGPQSQSLPQIGEHCSFTERRADDASRDVLQWLKAEYMQDFIGEEFAGRISGVKEFGIFVQLDAVFVDGLVHVTMMGNDYFHFDPLNFQMTGERTGRRFRLGDAVVIQVLRSDVETGKIDFGLVSLKGEAVEGRSDARPGGKPAGKPARKGKKSHSGKGSKQAKGSKGGKGSKGKAHKKSRGKSRKR